MNFSVLGSGIELDVVHDFFGVNVSRLINPEPLSVLGCHFVIHEVAVLTFAVSISGKVDLSLIRVQPDGQSSRCQSSTTVILE